MVCPVGFLMFGKGTLATYGFWSLLAVLCWAEQRGSVGGQRTIPGAQNNAKRRVWEPSGGFQLGGAESVCGRTENLVLGTQIVKNVQFGGPGHSPDPLQPMPSPRPLVATLQPGSRGSPRSPSDLQTRPTV